MHRGSFYYEVSQSFVTTRFCVKRGHWQSLLILDPYHIEHVVPMRPEHISECLHFHGSLKKGDSLFDRTTGEKLLDIFGDEIWGNKRQWSAPSNLFLFKSSVKKLHDNHDHSDSFKYECKECLKEYQESLNGESCETKQTPVTNKVAVKKILGTANQNGFPWETLPPMKISRPSAHITQKYQMNTPSTVALHSFLVRLKSCTQPCPLSMHHSR